MLGETIHGLDLGNHLWVVVSNVTVEEKIAIANLTTHGRARTCGGDCVVISPGEHPFVSRDTCVFYRRVDLFPAAPFLRDKERGTLRQDAPFSPELLRRVQDGIMASRLVIEAVKSAVRESLI